MRISETPFAFLLDDCIREFGEEAGRKIYQEADDVFSKLEAESDYKGNEAIREHIQMKLLPPLAYYKALLSVGYSRTEALDLVRTEDCREKERINVKDGKAAIRVFNLSHGRQEIHDKELP